MVDIHTHILPRLDDGAKDTKTSLAMLQTERAQGVETVVFTPHFYGRSHSPEQFIKRRNAAFERLKGQIPEGMDVRLGAEVHFTGINLPEYEELCKLAIEGTKYILIEFPFTTKWTWALTEKLADFIYDSGYTPIVAHVERYREVRNKPALVSELINMGCLIQVNARSFVEKSEKQFAFTLLKRGFVHCIGSDAHDTSDRSPDLVAAKEAVEKAGLAEEWNKVQEIMKKVLADEKLSFTADKPVKKVFGRYM